jgi:sporulation protein YlmC with PRC-barrel domain
VCRLEITGAEPNIRTRARFRATDATGQGTVSPRRQAEAEIVRPDRVLHRGANGPGDTNHPHPRAFRRATRRRTPNADAAVPGEHTLAGEAGMQPRARGLLDRDVRSSDGSRIGEVEDLMLGPDTGRVVSAVVEVERSADFDGRYLGLPIERLRLARRERWLTADTTREPFRTLPGIHDRD